MREDKTSYQISIITKILNCEKNEEFGEIFFKNETNFNFVVESVLSGKGAFIEMPSDDELKGVTRVQRGARAGACSL